jgi:23S rRNA pseudouridine1911/1915/1917 synthase
MTYNKIHNLAPGASHAGMRLDRFLAEAVPQLSRTRAQALIRAERATVGSVTITDPSARVKPGAHVRLSVPPPADPRPQPQAIALDVVYEDAALIVVDKPAGLVVHPAPGNPDRTLVNALLAHCAGGLSGIGGVRRPGIVHRLDKDTSGLMVAAKSDAAHQALVGAFAARRIDRVYRAVVWGVPMPRRGEIVGNIGRHPVNRKRFAVVARGGKPALTRYRVAQALGAQASVVECRLATGRTHQIRVHMADLGHAIVGDTLYRGGPRGRGQGRPAPDTAAREAAQRLGRQALHATHLGFHHPVSGERLHFESALPTEMIVLIESLDVA